MACFVVPAVEAVVTTAAKHIVQKREIEKVELSHESEKVVEESSIPLSRKLGWLNNMLWGGSALLAFEHVWHGEVTPWFPFLTAAANPADAAEMLREMSTVGVTMAVLVTAAWGIMATVASVVTKRAHAAEKAVE